MKEVPKSWELIALVGVVGSLAYGATIYFVTQYAYRWNLWFGFFCSLILAVVGLCMVAGGYAKTQNRVFKLNPLVRNIVGTVFSHVLEADYSAQQTRLRSYEMSFFMPVGDYFLTSWASLAYGFAKLRPSAYVHPEELTYFMMLRHYLWQLIDMIPVVDAWKQVHIEDPLRENHVWPGVLLIAFRLIDLYVVVAAASKIFQRGKVEPPNGRSNRA